MGREDGRCNGQGKRIRSGISRIFNALFYSNVQITVTILASAGKLRRFREDFDSTPVIYILPQHVYSHILASENTLIILNYILYEPYTTHLLRILKIVLI